MLDRINFSDHDALVYSNSGCVNINTHCIFTWSYIVLIVSLVLGCGSIPFAKENKWVLQLN